MRMSESPQGNKKVLVDFYSESDRSGRFLAGWPRDLYSQIEYMVLTHRKTNIDKIILALCTNITKIWTPKVSPEMYKSLVPLYQQLTMVALDPGLLIPSPVISPLE